MIADITNQELVIDCNDALLTSVFRMPNGDRVLHLTLKGEDCHVLDVMIEREKYRTIPVALALGQLAEAGGFVNQLHQTQKQITANEAAKPARPLGQNIKGPFGDFARVLKIHSFFRNKLVWQACGTDKQYRDWCHTQRCAYTKTLGNENDPIEAAHVRRIETGAGVSIKNEYATIPLLSSVHRLQHNQGESAVNGREWFEKQRIEHVTRWCWEVVRSQFKKDSFAQISPVELSEWARLNDVYDLLPTNYKNAWEKSVNEISR